MSDRTVLQDIVIDISIAYNNTADERGHSVYGIYLSNVRNFTLSRVVVTTADASNGADGVVGANGIGLTYE